MKQGITLFAFLLFAFGGDLSAQQQAGASGWTSGFRHEKVFIENQGQFNGMNGTADKILFSSDYDEVQYLFSPTGVTYRMTYSRQPNKEERQAIEARMKKMQAEGHDISHDDIEREEHRGVFYRELIHSQWLNANPNVKIIAEDQVSHYYTYTLNDGKLDHVSAFKKIIYKDLYPNIDVVYEFHPVTGIEYSFIVRPGGDMNQVKMNYTGVDHIDFDNQKGEIKILTTLGTITEHAPKTFYKNNPAQIIPSAFVVNGNEVAFTLGSYDKSQEIIVDPWVAIAPSFATQWDCVWEVERDGAGNAYLIGGTMPMQLLKYNTAGALQWTHSTPYDTTSWLGTFAVDIAGNSFVTLGSTAKIERVNTSGVQVWSNTSPGGLFGNTEFWSIAFNCDQSKLVIGGTGGQLLNILPYIYDVDMSSGNITASVQVTGGVLFPTQEVRAIAACGNAKYCYLTHDSIGYIQQSLNACASSGSLPFHVSNGYSFGYKCENWRVNNTGIAAIRYYGGFMYTCRGNQVHKRSFTTGAIVATATIPGGAWASNQVRNAGIDIDSCGNVYVGSANQLVKYDANLNQLATYPTSINFNIYDVAIASSGNVIVGGSTGTSSSGARQGYIQSIAAGACNPISLICCNTNICQVPPKCTTDGPVTLVVGTPGGTFSGTAVNPTTGVFTPSVAGVGVFKIVYTLPCGSDSIFITVNSCTAISVCKEANGNLTVSGGTGPYTWSVWDSIGRTCQGGIVFGGICTGTWVKTMGWKTFTTGVTVTPPAGRDSIRVVDNAGTTVNIYGLATVPLCSPCPTITVATTPTSSRCGLANGSATTTVTGGTTPYTYTWSNSGGSSAGLTNVLAGTYTVTVRDASLCAATATVTIANIAGPTATSTKTDANCNGANNGTMTVNTSGGTGSLTYTWSPNVSTTSTASSLAPNTYSVTVEDANNCTVVTSQTIGQPSAVTIATSSVPASCGASNGSATATPSGGTGAYTYAWTGGATSATASNLASGTYSVTVRDANLCSATASVTVGSTSAITTTMSSTPTGCGAPTGKAKVTVTGGSGPFTYLWSNGQTADSTSALTGGYVTVTVTGAGNCTKVDSVLVTTSGALPNINAGVDTSLNCVRTSLTLQATSSTAGVTFAWSNSTNTASTSVSAANTYTVTATDPINGCTASDAVVVTLNNTIPNVNAGLDTSLNCVRTSLILQATSTTTGVTFAWSNAANTANTSVSTANTYTVTATDPANGCTASDAVVVTLNNTIPNVNAGLDTSLNCVRTSLTLQATSTTTGVTFVWSNGTNASSTNVSTANTYTVTVVNVTNGCTASDAVNVTLNISTPNVDAGLDQVLSCASSSATLTGSSTTAGATYAWSGPGVVSGGNTLSPNVNTSGTFTLLVTDPSNGCTASDIVNVTPNVNTPNVNAGVNQTLTCLVTSVTLTATSTTSGVTFAWSNGANVASITVNAPNTYTVTVTNPSNSCVAVGQVIVSQNTQAPANVSAGLDQVLTCNVSSVTLTGSSSTVGVTYAWSNGLGNASSTTTSSIGTYVLTVTNPANGCTATDSVQVTNGVQSLSATINTTDPKCANYSDGNAVVHVSGGTEPFTYTWSSTPNGGNDSIVANLTAPQSVGVTITDVNGCSTTVTSSITNPQAPDLTLLPQDTTVEYGSNVVLKANLINFTAQSYMWSPTIGLSCSDCANPTLNVNAENTTYTVIVSYNNGCTVTRQTVVKAEANNKLYVPNAFTPNGDGNNDVFNVFLSNYKEFSLVVFNRWGEKVFEGEKPQLISSQTPKFGWDGTYKGASQPVEVYVYSAVVVFLNGEKRQLKGSVTLIR